MATGSGELSVDLNTKEGASSRARDPSTYMDTTIESTNQDATISLAPAAGAGIGKLLADCLLADPTFVTDLVAAFRNGLKATRSFYVKDEGMHSEPDAKTQLQAAALVLAHMEGEPVKRIIHQHLGAGGQLDIMGALRESPALLAAAEREIEKAKWKGGKKAKKVEAEPGPSVQ